MVEEVPARGSILGNCLPARYVLAVLGSIGMAITYGLKVNLSVAMVAMLNHTAMSKMDGGGHGGHGGHGGDDAVPTTAATILTTGIPSTVLHAVQNLTVQNVTQTFARLVSESAGGVEVCHPPGGAEKAATVEDGPFIWSTKVQGILLSCYFWGYLVSQIPSARIAEGFSARWVMLVSVGINILCTLLTPVLTKLHYVGLILMRVLEGVSGGATFPAMHCMIAAWAPPNERSVMSTIIYVGTSFGTAISILLAGVLSDQFGWESVFYVMGGLSCIWMVLWAILVQDNPRKQPFISAEERQMITSSLGKDGDENAGKEEHPPVPWRNVLTSVPFWAILIAHLCSNWGWYMFLIEVPFYMKQVLKFNVSSNALASAFPYFPLLIFSIILGKTLDTLKAKQIINTTIARKVATSFATIVPAICLLTLCYIGCKHTAAVIIMSIGVIAMGGMFPGFLSNHIDIAPNYAGTLVALTNTVATLPGIIVPNFVGTITATDQTINAWRIIFFVTIVLFSIEFVVFTIFGSGEEQSWNKRTTGQKDPERTHDESTPLKPTASSPTKSIGGS